MTATQCEKGPWHGKLIDNYSAVPAQVVPCYAPQNTGMQCDDEQVITLLGWYVRFTKDCGSTTCDQGCPSYQYLWSSQWIKRWTNDD